MEKIIPKCSHLKQQILDIIDPEVVFDQTHLSFFLLFLLHWMRGHVWDHDKDDRKCELSWSCLPVSTQVPHLGDCLSRMVAHYLQSRGSKNKEKPPWRLLIQSQQLCNMPSTGFPQLQKHAKINRKSMGQKSDFFLEGRPHCRRAWEML